MKMRVALVITAALGVIGSLPSASADPHDAAIVGVFPTSACSADPCAPGADRSLASGAVVGGEVQVFVSAKADLGLEWVRLEAQFPGDPRFYCLEFWNANRSTTFSAMRRWNTTHWTDPRKGCAPESCSHCIETSPHQHGRVSDNVAHTLRVVAHEQVGNAADDVSTTFELKLQNAPAAPTWKADPVAATTSTGAAVSLLWPANGDPDIVEYRYVRSAPGAPRAAFAISAAHPERQGCQRLADGAYKCIDSITSGAPSGSYAYSIAAVRNAYTGPACEVVRGRCIVGPLSQARTVSVKVAPAPSGQPTDTASGGPVPSSIANPSTAPAPVSVSPPPVAVAVGGTKEPGSRGSTAVLPIAAGGLIALSAGVAGWIHLKRSRAA